MARSNIVKRRFTDGHNDSFDVFDCQTCQREFSRPTMRGVKPLDCPLCAPAPKPPKAKAEPKPKAESESEGEAKKAKPKAHKQFKKLLTYCQASLGSTDPVQAFMYGPAGSGKTYAASEAAKALGLDFRAESCSIGGTETDFFGFIGATHYNRTAFRDVWEHGGLFLFDEMDAASPYVLTKINAALASRPGQTIEFPDGSIPRHKNAVLIGAGNTNMRGGSDDYHTRQPADAALPTRFAFIEWDYDEAFERSLVPDEYGYWVDRVQTYRKSIKATGVKGVYSTPRATITGVNLLRAGETVKAVEDAVIWQGVERSIIRTVKEHAGV